MFTRIYTDKTFFWSSWSNCGFRLRQWFCCCYCGRGREDRVCEDGVIRIIIVTRAHWLLLMWLVNNRGNQAIFGIVKLVLRTAADDDSKNWRITTLANSSVLLRMENSRWENNPPFTNIWMLNWLSLFLFFSLPLQPYIYIYHDNNDYKWTATIWCKVVNIRFVDSALLWKSLLVWKTERNRIGI